MPTYGYAVLAVAWVCWCAPFFTLLGRTGKTLKIDRRARWGIMLEAVGYSLLWQGQFWKRALPDWRLSLCLVLFVAACWLSWTGARALGKHWRVDAGLSTEHELVRTGAYRLVRHPIYASMLCMLVGTGVVITPWWLLLPAIIVFVIGTEIRVRVEDELLAGRFGESFREYKSQVPAYIPFVR